MGDAGAIADRILGARRIPEIALEIGDLRLGNDLRLDVFRAKLDACTEIGIHGTLTIFGDEDHRAGGGRKGAARLGLEMDALSADIVLEDLAELIFGHLAEIGCRCAKVGNARCRIACTSARRFQCRTHERVEQFRALRIDQVHRALGNGVIDEETVIAARNNIHDGVANGQYVEFCHEPLVRAAPTRCVIRNSVLKISADKKREKATWPACTFGRLIFGVICLS